MRHSTAMMPLRRIRQLEPISTILD